MSEKIDVKVVEAILYALYKSLHKLAGASAPAIMRQAGPDMLEELGKLGVDFSCVDDIEKLENKLRETMSNTGMCDGIDFSMDGDDLTSKIHGCSFHALTSQLESEGIEPFGCPFSALSVALAEKNLGKRAKIKDLHTEGGGDGDCVLVVEMHEK